MEEREPANRLELAYAAAPRGSRWLGRRYVALLLLLTVLGILGVMYAPALFTQGQALRRQAVAADHAAPADHVVYIKEPVYGAPEGVTPPPGAPNRYYHLTDSSPGPWKHLAESAGAPIAPVLFLRPRKTPGGTERLVYVFVSRNYVPRVPGGLSITTFGLTAAVIIPGTATRPPEFVAPAASNYGFSVPETGPLRLFAGQADPSNSSHFTIAYEAGSPNGAGVIDGWLKDDYTVRLLHRTGPARTDMSP